MLTKTINVSGQIVTANNISVNVNFNYHSSINDLNQIDFNFNKNEVNVFGSYNPKAKALMNYSVNNGIIEKSVVEDVVARLDVLAEDPENEDLYETEI